MYFGLSGFGISPFVWSCPTSSTINSIYVSNGIYDEIKIDDTLDIENSITKETWGLNTQLLADFKDNLEGGNIDNGGLPVQKLRFKRRVVGDLLWETMTEINYNKDISNYDLNDYFVKNATNYEYKMIPVTQFLEGSSNSASIKTNYESLYLTGMLDGSLSNYPLRFDLQTSDITTNDDKTYVKTLASKFPAIMGGKSCYKTGTVTATLMSPTTEEASGNVDMEAENVYRTAFESFLDNNMPKLIRYHSFYYLVTLSEIKMNPLSDECGFGIWKYNFKFTEYDEATLPNLLKYNLEYKINTSS
jgi:hypothetical protein